MAHMDNIFLSVVHLVKDEQADDCLFAELLQQLKCDLCALESESVPASVTVVAETGLFSCNVSVGVTCGHEKFYQRLDTIADSYRGTFLMHEKRTA